MNLRELHLVHPELLHGLWLWLVVAGGLALLDARAVGRLGRLVAPPLEARLVVRPAAWRRHLRHLFLALAGLCMVAALVRPQWGEQRVATPRVGAEIMIALDVSRSMLADDARPSRLERAKAEIADLLAYLENDQVGLIAFAGRASILSPLTPDKSFLRLALESAGPHSVSRGGTRLAEPILRAVAGLGEPGPAQRALILITDGEDHDSFALDAAKKAAAAGIKIITIGFGSESGSEIHVVDPADGSRTLVRDGDGNPVVSRLDGEMLREIALATDGAYVPAGTGVLDLASIYDAHIARLTRGQLDARGRVIRGETYPIFVGAALVCLVAAVAISAGRARPAPRSARSIEERRNADFSRVAATLLVALAGAHFGAAPVRAADAQGANAAQPGANSPVAPSAGAPPAGNATTAKDAESETSGPPASQPPASPPAPAPVETPRERFNRANAALAAGDAAAASSLYREARRDATDDVALRYAASFNLGMAAVAQADRLEATKPQAALTLLHEAADWFREAVSMQPDDDDPRHNLEVALRRALILADAIARRNRKTLEAELDGLIETQRGRVAESAMLLEATVRAGELAAADALHASFDAAATAQRELMADVESIADRAADEKAILEAKPEAERKPEDLLRGASLEGVLAYLDQGVERMGQTRRQLRQRAAERAYRRGAEALDALKRARDQLRDPVEQIGVLIGEVTGVAGGAAALEQADSKAERGEKSAAATPTPPATDSSDGVRLPAFLTPEAVAAETAAVGARVGELAQRFGAAAEKAKEQGNSAPSGASASGSAPGSSPSSTPPSAGAGDAESSEDMRAAILAAAPLIERSSEAMTRASDSLEQRAYRPTLDAEGEAVAALAEARELFLDLRELLDLTHASQARIAGAAAATGAEADAARAKARAALGDEQRRDRARVDRLARLLEGEREKQRAALEAPAPDAGDAADATSAGAGPDPEALAALDARFDRADVLLGEARVAMDEAVAAFGAGASARANWSRVGETGGRAAERLDAIRLLFLSLVEHLARLEREQTNVADRTRDAIALAAGDGAAPARGEATQRRASALASEQKELEGRAGAIADALVAQSDAAAKAGETEGAAGGGPSAPGAGPDRATLRRAADHVATAQLEMQKSHGVLADDGAPLPPAEPPQRVAREELRKALALLSPPPPEEPQDQNQDQQQKQDQSQQEGDSQDEGSQGEGRDEQQKSSQADPQSGDEGDSNEGQGEEGANEQEEQASQGGASQEEQPAGADEAAGAREDESGFDGAQDPSQLLQGVRDREAERRATNERRDRTRRRSAPVEKDW